MAEKTKKQKQMQSLEALSAIKKKLLGKSLNYREVFSLMDEVASQRLGPVLTTYFVAAGFKEGFSNTELFYLTKAMAETGSKLHFKGIVADKHSTGGLAGTRTTMIVVPIVAAAGFKIPKNSSRAITTPAGTADTMEVLAPVTFPVKKIEKIVKKVGGCILWGGHLGLAPADDIIIQVEAPLSFESFDKIIVSIMAKKIGIKVTVDINQALEPAGHGVGPALEARDVLKVLEQKPDRPYVLEAKALRLAGKLLDLCFSDTKIKEKISGEETAREILRSGRALKKMKEIIKIQGGDPSVSSYTVPLGKFKFEVESGKKGSITSFNNRELTVIAKILGCPQDKQAGIYLNRRIDEKVDRRDILCILYSSDKWRLEEAKDTLKNLPIYKIVS